MTLPFKVVTYNVLANDCRHLEYYPNIVSEHLNSRLRYPRLVEKIAGFDADILCLQEVDDALYAQLEPALKLHDYHGFHQLKTGKTDGLATFLRESLHKKYEHGILRFSGLGLDNKPIAHIAIITRLAIGSATLTIANTHLKWDNPNTPLDERIGYNHAKQLLKTLRLFHTGPQIVCGDFNAEPTNEILTAFKLDGYCATHRASASTFNAASGGVRKIDYILCNSRLIFNPLPTPQITSTTALPSEDEPSDHLPLIAEFGFMA